MFHSYITSHRFLFAFLLLVAVLVVLIVVFVPEGGSVAVLVLGAVVTVARVVRFTTATGGSAGGSARLASWKISNISSLGSSESTDECSST